MKKYFIGFIVGAMLMVSTSAFAAVGDTVSAVFAKYTYQVNGVAKDVNSPVLTYEGTTYLRTTDLGNLLGYDVTYMADTKTIAFHKDEPVYVPTPTLEPVPSGTVESPKGATSGTTSGTTEKVVEPVTGEPSPSPEPTASPIPTPTASPEPSPSPSPEPVVVDNSAQCQAIRDDYTLRIFNAGTVGDNPKLVEFNQRQLASARDAALASAGCQ